MKPDRGRADEFSPEILRLFDRYVHGDIDRRGFLDEATKLTAGSVAAAAVLDALSPNYGLAAEVPPEDPRIRAEMIEYPSPGGSGVMRGYLARPDGPPTPRPAVLVIHENRGLNPYIEDVVRRFAAEGFLALGPDALTPLGGYPGNDDEGRAMQRQLDRATMTEDFVAGLEFLLGHDDATGRVGAVGFCFGGGMVNTLAVRRPDLAAGVPFYGSQPAVEDVEAIEAPLMIHYAEFDERINAGWPDFEAALQRHGKTYVMHMYAGANHGFHNDTTPRYDADAARLAQQRTVEFFRQHLEA